MDSFAIKCNNNIEFEAAQKYLFSMGFKWRDSNKNIMNVTKFPIIITQDYYQNNNLIYHEHKHCDKDFNEYYYNYKYLKSININIIMRKQKLNKINEI